MLLLAESDVVRVLSVAIAYRASATAFYCLAHDIGTTPNRLVTTHPGTGTVTLYKPASISNAIGIKIVSVQPRNADAVPAIATVPATITLINSVDGRSIALIAATRLTAIRTAAGSAVATSLFAVADAHTMTVFGSGMQARAHIEAIMAIRPSVTHIHIVNRTRSRSDELVRDCKRSLSAVTFALHNNDEHDNVRAATLASQIICMTTASSTPLLHLDMVLTGTHINAVGSYQVDAAEVADDIVQNATITIDSQAAFECGELNLLTADQRKRVTLIGAHINNDYAPTTDAQSHSNQNALMQSTRTHETSMTLFKSVGTAAQDILTADAVYHSAKANGLGTEFDIDA